MVNHLSQKSKEDLKAFLQKLEQKEFTGLHVRLNVQFANGQSETYKFVFGNVFFGLSRGQTFIEDISGSTIYKTSYYDFSVFKLFNANWFYFEELNGNKVMVEFVK